MALTTLTSGLDTTDFIAAVENNGQWSRYNNCDYTTVLSTMTGSEFVDAVNGNLNDAKAEYRFSPSVGTIAVGDRGSSVISVLNAGYSAMEATLNIKTVNPMLTIRCDDGTNGDLAWETYLTAEGLHATSCILEDKIGDGGYLSEANIGVIFDAGWEIQSHGISTNINELSDDDILTTLQSTRSDLEAIVGAGNVNGFSVHGWYSEALKPFVKKVYKWNCSFWDNDAEGIDVINLHEFDLLQMKATLVGTDGTYCYLLSEEGKTHFYEVLDLVAANNGWLIIVVHSAHATFLDVMDVAIPYCATKGINIVSIEEGINSCILR